MKKSYSFLLCIVLIGCMGLTCKKQQANITPTPVDTSLVNLSHLNNLYIPVTFPDSVKAAGIYIYADAPDYHPVEASGEGFTCVDDVSRAVLVYIRNDHFLTDTSIQNKTYNLLRFIIEMQSANGYFYNFLETGNSINKFGPTSINTAQWWSWRALQALTEAYPVIKNLNSGLASQIDQSVNKLIAVMKADEVNIPQTTKIVEGITVPQWLPAGSGTDQAATIILGLIPYCTQTNDAVMSGYIKKLADGIVMMQYGDATHFPHSCILSWENTWHAYATDQAYALFKAGLFLHDTTYTASAIAFADNFLTWLLQNGMESSFVVSQSNGSITAKSELLYDQIAYGIRPMVFAAVEAFNETHDAKYADIAGQLAAWFFGNNAGGKTMYFPANGIGYDGLSSPTAVNQNSGAESTIEALMTMEKVEMNPEVKTAMNKYKK